MARYIKGSGADIYRLEDNGTQTYVPYDEWVSLGRPGFEMNWQAGLSGPNRDAALMLQDLFKSYGLETLAPKIIEYIQGGYTADTIGVLLSETQEYKKRFAGNEKRRAAGLPVLTPAEYLATEASYKQIMNQAGLPATFYDQPEDFDAWIGGDVSPQEIQSRVESAQKLVESVDPLVRAEFERMYTRGDMVAYALDRSRTTTILDRQVRAAQIGAAGSAAGIGVTSVLAEQIADQGVGEQEARQGFGAASEMAQAGGRLGAVYGEEYDAEDATKDVFLADAGAAGKRKRLASQERAAFSGGGGLTETSLSKRRAGSL